MKVFSWIYTGKITQAVLTVLLAASIITITACGKVNIPVIQQSNMPTTIVEGQSIDLTVHTASYKPVKSVYIQFNERGKAPLTKMVAQKKSQEFADWGVVLNLPAGEYTYSIVAEDEVGNKSLPLEGKITVTPNNPKVESP